MSSVTELEISGRSSKRGANRWVIAGAAVVVMVTTGTFYGWTILAQPLLMAFRWNVTVTTVAYAIANFCVAAVGTLIGGCLLEKKGPRSVAMIGVTLWAAGNILTGLGTTALGAPWLYLAYGVVGGIGAGMAYITPMSMVTKWFPDRKGLIGGLVAGGFGFGAFLYAQIVPRLNGVIAATRPAASSELSRASDVAALMHVFVGSGIIYLLVGLSAASLFRNPAPSNGQTGPTAARRGSSSPLSQILRTRLFYLLWLQLFVNVLAGTTIISNAVQILKDLTNAPVATLAVLFGWVSLFNAAGRPLWGAVSDRIGSRNTFTIMFAIQGLTLLWLNGVQDLPFALGGFAVILLCCGGGFGVMPAYSAECFGTKSMGTNYALILSAWGVAGFVGPVLVARAKDLNGSFVGVLPMIATVLLVSIVLPFLTKVAPAGVLPLELVGAKVSSQVN